MNSWESNRMTAGRPWLRQYFAQCCLPCCARGLRDWLRKDLGNSYEVLSFPMSSWEMLTKIVLFPRPGRRTAPAAYESLGFSRPVAAGAYDVAPKPGDEPSSTGSSLLLPERRLDRSATKRSNTTTTTTSQLIRLYRNTYRRAYTTSSIFLCFLGDFGGLKQALTSPFGLRD